MHRFFLNLDDQITKNQISINNPDLIHQLLKVLRIKDGQNLILINPTNQTEYQSQIESSTKKSIQTKIVQQNNPNRLPTINLNLHFAILKNPDKIELILQKCTEIGVKEFTPIITDRTEKKFLPKQERLERILKEASEQSGRTEIPILHSIKKFSDCLNSKQFNLIADPYSANKLTKFKNQNINLFIGPEGGFTEQEIEQTVQNKFTTFNMGQLILRAETACIVASSQILI